MNTPKMRVLEQDDIDVVNSLLIPYGLRATGGSMEEKKLNIFICKGCSATYNRGRVGELLMNLCGLDTVVLDGIVVRRGATHLVWYVHTHLSLRWWVHPFFYKNKLLNCCNEDDIISLQTFLKEFSFNMPYNKIWKEE